MTSQSCLERAIRDAAAAAESELGLAWQESRIQVLPELAWSAFLEKHRLQLGLHSSDEGIYVPARKKAYVREGNPFLIPTVFHELFGHGLFCEHSKLGRPLVAYGDDFAHSQSYLSEKVNPEVQPLGLASQNLWNYEGFAVWMEGRLSEATGNGTLWQMKKNMMRPDYADAYGFFMDAERRLGTPGFLSQMGFPNRQTPQQAVECFRRLYAKDFSNVEYILLYGSRRPESDIDLFVVSRNPSMESYNGWLDVSEKSREELEQLKSLLSINVTDPLMTGELIYGDRSRFEADRDYVRRQPITVEAIQHSRCRAEDQREKAVFFCQNPRHKRTAERYAYSYSRNAHYLTQGRKMLTLKSIVQADSSA